MDPLKRIEQELKKCVKCGACRAHCPVFSVVGREPASARGKVALARAALSGGIGLDARTRSDMSKCLLCGRCVEKCANDVPTDLIVLAARRSLASEKGLTVFHKMVGLFLKNPGLMTKGSWLASVLSPFLFRRVPSCSGLRLRFQLPFMGGRRHIPPIASKPFLDRHPEVIVGEADRPSVFYFAGCMTNFIYPEIGEAAVTILKSLGCTVIMPKDQRCCGFPALSGGDMDTFRSLAEANLSSMERRPADYIMTACASCGGAFHRMYPRLSGDGFPELAARFRAVAEKVVDAAELLEHLGFSSVKTLERKPERITYHDPCHLRNRSVTGQPRRLLQAAPGVEFVEMDGADSCCGLGGTFTIHHYGASMAINARKTNAIRKSGATAVATGCPGCMLHISDGLQQGGMDVRVMHTLEILAKELKS